MSHYHQADPSKSRQAPPRPSPRHPIPWRNTLADLVGSQADELRRRTQELIDHSSRPEAVERQSSIVEPDRPPRGHPPVRRPLDSPLRQHPKGPVSQPLDGQVHQSSHVPLGQPPDVPRQLDRPVHPPRDPPTSQPTRPGVSWENDFERKRIPENLDDERPTRSQAASVLKPEDNRGDRASLECARINPCRSTNYKVSDVVGILSGAWLIVLFFYFILVLNFGVPSYLFGNCTTPPPSLVFEPDCFEEDFLIM